MKLHLFAMAPTAVLSFGAASAALADGFVCSTKEQDLNVKIYHHVTPEHGTRSAAVMVVSNPDIASPNKTIAVFKDSSATLTSTTGQYVGKVDARFRDLSRGGELISGTKLGQLKQAIVEVDFSYLAPLLDGEETSATLTLVKRNGEELSRDLICTRYLKN
jgi:hypothetical protein